MRTWIATESRSEAGLLFNANPTKGTSMVTDDDLRSMYQQLKQEIAAVRIEADRGLSMLRERYSEKTADLERRIESLEQRLQETP